MLKYVLTTVLLLSAPVRAEDDDLRKALDICAKHISSWGSINGLEQKEYESNWEGLCRGVNKIQASEIAKEQAEAQRQRDITAKPDYDFVDKFVRSH